MGLISITNYFGFAGLSLDFVTSSDCGGGMYSGGLFLVINTSSNVDYEKNTLSAKITLRNTNNTNPENFISENARLRKLVLFSIAAL